MFSLLLNVNLPDLLTVWMSLNKPISWNIENPFNLTIAKLNKVRGKLSKNLPPKANKIAKNIEPKKINLRNSFDIFLGEVFAINFNIKKIIPKIISVKMSIFIYLVFSHENTTTKKKIRNKNMP